MAQSVTLSSIGTATINLNPVARTTTLMISLTSASTGAVTLEASLDDPTIAGGPTATWAMISSGAAMASSSVFTNGGLVYTLLTPIAAVRLNSTATNGAINLKALQSVTA
jgi:hypothetical protein